MLYDTILIPTLTYAASAWSHAVIFKYIEKRAAEISGLGPFDYQIVLDNSVNYCHTRHCRYTTIASSYQIPGKCQPGYRRNYPYEVDTSPPMLKRYRGSISSPRSSKESRYWLLLHGDERYVHGGCATVQLPPYCSMLQADHFIMLQAIAWGQEYCFAVPR
ncbi:hypothetical protein DERF_003990 [Dermatophagoides farinae]|uniref:Uncharacterized protein n=1 Tax=Dermatophagoides farinae TaxID=6954 RepID=A0A922IF78_DERFA|nr:hypothetical protein DERF_003990 [Dermatophagoides farinae]